MGPVARMVERRPEGKRPLVRPRLGWEDNTKVDLQEMECGGNGLDISGSGHGHVAGACGYGNEHSGSIKCGEFRD